MAEKEIMPISLCLIVKNEEDFLEQCLESAKGFVDEIIVVDTGSTDKTIEIAKKFTDKVFSHAWPDDFSKARNISLGYATKDWILVLDADEIIDEEGFKKIKELIKDESAEGYSFIQRNYTDNSALIRWVPCYKESKYTRDFTGYRPSRLVRLFRNKKGYSYRNKVHELVEYSIEEKGGKIVLTDIPIHHYGELKEESIRKAKGKKYFELGEKQIKERPDDARAYYETGVGCLVQKDFEKAIEKFEKVIELNPNYKDIYYNLGSAYHSTKEEDKAEKALRESIKRNPQSVAAYNLLGKILFDKRNADEAVAVLIKGINVNNRSALLYKTLGGVLAATGKTKEAIAVLKDGINLAPRDAGLRVNLGGAYFADKDYENAAAELQNALEIDDSRFDIYKNLFVVYLNKGDKENAVKIFEKAKTKFPELKAVIDEQLEKINK